MVSFCAMLNCKWAIICACPVSDNPKKHQSGVPTPGLVFFFCILIFCPTSWSIIMRKYWHQKAQCLSHQLRWQSPAGAAVYLGHHAWERPGSGYRSGINSFRHGEQLQTKPSWTWCGTIILQQSFVHFWPCEFSSRIQQNPAAFKAMILQIHSRT